VREIVIEFGKKRRNVIQDKVSERITFSMRFQKNESTKTRKKTSTNLASAKFRGEQPRD